MIFLFLNCDRLHLALELDSFSQTQNQVLTTVVFILSLSTMCCHWPASHTWLRLASSPGWVGPALGIALLLSRMLLGDWIPACNSIRTHSAALGLDPSSIARGTLCCPVTSYERGTTQTLSQKLNWLHLVARLVICHLLMAISSWDRIHIPFHSIHLFK